MKPKPPKAQMGMFDEEGADEEEDKTHAYEKIVNIDGIKDYFVERLQTVFRHVAEEPRWLYNNRGMPIYILCFASHNDTALRIARDLLKK